jgi:hypothetical protein
MSRAQVIQRLNVIEDHLWQLALPFLEREEACIWYADLIDLAKESFEELTSEIEPAASDNEIFPFLRAIQNQFNLLASESSCFHAIKLALLISLLSSYIDNQSEWCIEKTRLAVVFHNKINTSKLGFPLNHRKPADILRESLKLITQ